MSQIHFVNKIESEIDEAYEYFTDPNKWCALVDDPFDLELLSGAAQFKVGSEYLFNVDIFGIVQEMRFSITEDKPKIKITYRQKNGFFKFWSHSIEFQRKEGQNYLVEDISYEMPFGILGTLFDDFWVKSKIKLFISDRIKNYNIIFS